MISGVVESSYIFYLQSTSPIDSETNKTWSSKFNHAKLLADVILNVFRFKWNQHSCQEFDQSYAS